MELTSIYTPRAVAEHWEEVASNQIPYIGTALFPARKKAGLDLAWIKGSKGLPISLMPSAFDAKATFRDRIGVKRLETEMPFFREGFKIKEKDRQEILRVQEQNDPYLDEVLARIYDDADELIAGANVVPERMIMQLLFPTDGQPKIVIQANGVDYSYNYDPDGSWYNAGSGGNYFVLTSGALWTATTTADPFTNFKTVQDAISAKTGTKPTVAVMNSTTFNLLSKIDAVKNRFLSASGIALGYISDGDVKRVFADTNGIAFIVYDKQYKNESGTAAKFVPDGYVAILPEGALGSTWYGTTPEEADLRGGASDAKVAIVNTGVAITQIVDTHPVNINTFASEIVLPSYERMNEVALLKVTA